MTQEGKEMNAGDARKLILKIIEEQSKGQNPQYLNVAPGPPGPPRSPGSTGSTGPPRYLNVAPGPPGPGRRLVPPGAAPAHGPGDSH